MHLLSLIGKSDFIMLCCLRDEFESIRIWSPFYPYILMIAFLIGVPFFFLLPMCCFGSGQPLAIKIFNRKNLQLCIEFSVHSFGLVWCPVTAEPAKLHQMVPTCLIFELWMEYRCPRGTWDLFV